MSGKDRLQIAIAKAKSGHELSARDLFLEIVKDDPRNKLAWLWLVGLLDDTDDLINACEHILQLDPADKRVQLRLEELIRLRSSNNEKRTEGAIREVYLLLDLGEREPALIRLREIVKININSEAAWNLILEHATDLNEQVWALTHALALDPKNEQKRASLRRLRYFEKHPFELASSYEERGEIDQAIKLYENLAINANGRKEWNHIFREINRLENLKKENIVHISPVLTTTRLTAGPPLLFISLVIIQTGYSFQYFTLLMGIEFLLVILGSFLLALASTNAENRLWKRLGNAAGRGSSRLRYLLGATGLTIMILPFVQFGFEAFARWPTALEYLGITF